MILGGERSSWLDYSHDLEWVGVVHSSPDTNNNIVYRKWNNLERK